jgi:hypothetical protein
MAGGGVLLSNNKSSGLPPSLKLSWWCVFLSEKENEVRLGEREFTWGHTKGKKREKERFVWGTCGLWSQNGNTSVGLGLRGQRQVGRLRGWKQIGRTLDGNQTVGFIIFVKNRLGPLDP